jgi:nucleolin
MKRQSKRANSDDSDEASVEYKQNKKVVNDSDSDDQANHSDAGSNAGDDKKEIFIKSLSYDIDEDMLAKIFGKYGKMSKCKLIQQNGRSRGIAFIEYESAASAKKALDAENGQSHAGRDITVDFSGNKPDAP